MCELQRINDEMDVLEKALETLGSTVTMLENDVTGYQNTGQPGITPTTINDIITTERSNFEMLCTSIEQIKQNQTSSQEIFKTFTEESLNVFSKGQSHTKEEVQNVRDDIIRAEKVVDSLVSQTMDIESMLSLGQIRQYSSKNYLPKMSQFAEIMQHNTIYVLSSFWVCGLLQYNSTPVLCFWNTEKTLALHIFNTFCLIFQNSQEYKYDMSKGSLARVEKDPHVAFNETEEYVSVEVQSGAVLTPMGKAKQSFVVNTECVLLRFDSGDMLAIDTLGESIFIDGKLVTI
ncbi:hypothetical protein EIN_429030 [Entamoeba invadens IP1]|uniref:Uncharacterized protein n=1 Tax=Entamoeba invadens IP1 TaxID=370355 RepID=A0A0A1UHE0_ENTIV|nr:hypothetical protein EIN_429030 [Entamoeba invadens IP1]ELP95157.1 hypothetical protein EIN_429030 [Entamoeba invadens IP1]|eukprot:XP_004261928.1 hypothetical protein EIN_429030 [Entamoeba invadens IP1]